MQAKVVKQRENEEGKTQIQFRFKGWGAKFDEWIDADDERIQPHNLYTDPTSKNPRAQEKWQGVKIDLSSKDKMEKKRRALDEKDSKEKSADAQGKRRKSGNGQKSNK